MKPSPNGTDGRLANGRFAPGNKLGRGNPHGQLVNELRAAMLEAIAPADIRAAVSALVREAHAGNIAAIKELLDRTVGKEPLVITADVQQAGPTMIFYNGHPPTSAEVGNLAPNATTVLVLPEKHPSDSRS